MEEFNYFQVVIKTYSSSIISLIDIDGTSFADMVYYGSFFMCILQIISILGKDKSPIMVKLLELKIIMI